MGNYAAGFRIRNVCAPKDTFRKPKTPRYKTQCQLNLLVLIDLCSQAQLFPDGVLCMYSALFYYRYSDRTPLEWNIAVDRDTSKSRFRLDYPFVQPYYMKKDLLKLGVTTADYGDCTMQIFDRDRLICDCIFSENKMDRETYNKAIQGYVGDPKKNIPQLLEYAEKRRILKKVKDRIGVWL